jgi:hypothetical protein
MTPSFSADGVGVAKCSALTRLTGEQYNRSP